MSIWNLKEENTIKTNLNKSLEVDTLIVGGGMTGLQTAYFLKNQQNIAIVEASQIGHGVTLGSTAKINYLQSGIYSKIIKTRGKNLASIYLESQIYAASLLKSIIEKEKIECSFKEVPSYIFSNTKEEDSIVKSEIEFLRSNNIPITEDRVPNDLQTISSYKVDNTFIFNPLKYLNALKRILTKNDISIYENTRILKIDYIDNTYICFTNTNQTIKTKRIVFATNYPYFTIPFLLPFKGYCKKSYIIISKVLEDKNLTCINPKNPIYSCRFYKEDDNIYQISLSKSHNISFNQNDLYNFKKVQVFFDLKDENIITSYSNTDIMTPDSLPYIGEIKKDMYIACGFNTWGMTNSILSSKIISDNILEIENKYSKYYNPNRITLIGLLSLPYIIFSQTKAFLGTKLLKNKSWYNNQVKFIKENSINYAIYTDKKGKEHKVINKCPHLGCSLIFNEVEKSWDCPCHSSRFDLDGKCIKGPSNYDISP